MARAAPGGGGAAVETGGPLPAAPAEMAHSGSAHDEPGAAQEAAGEQEAGTGQDEPPVSGDDDEDRPAVARGAAAAGASADPVKDYLKQIGRVALLNATPPICLR